MSDLDTEIVALRVSGLSEPEICVQLGCRLARVRAALRVGERGRVPSRSKPSLSLNAPSRRAAATRHCCGKSAAGGRASGALPLDGPRKPWGGRFRPAASPSSKRLS
jgi:hypothetical protein